METQPRPDLQNEALWRMALTQGHQSKWALLLSNPRCTGCSIPFGSFGGVVANLFGRRASRKNPNFCNYCDDMLPPGGAEVDVAVLFADVRGSTALGERLGPTAFAALLDRFTAQRQMCCWRTTQQSTK